MREREREGEREGERERERGRERGRERELNMYLIQTVNMCITINYNINPI